MYQEIHKDLIAQNKDKAQDRKLNLGMALRQILRQKRIDNKELLKKAKLNESTLKNLLHYGEMNTNQKNFLKLVDALNVSVEEFVNLARETSQTNFHYVEKSKGPILKYDTHEIEVYSPPQYSKKDFVLCLVRINPKQRILVQPMDRMEPVCGIVVHGHLNLTYGNKSSHIHTNQLFLLDPNQKHSYTNSETAGTVDFYIVYRLKPEHQSLEITEPNTNGQSNFSVSSLIHQIRKELSPSPNKLLSVPHLSALSGVDANALNHLLFRNTKVIPFEKLELLANTTDYSFEQIVQKTQNRYEGWIKTFTDEDKIIVDLSLRFGIRFVNHFGIGTVQRSFSAAEFTLNPYHSGDRKLTWTYKSPGFMAIKVERGVLGLQIGNQPLKTLKWGDTVYFNTDIGMSLENLISIEKGKELGESSEPKAILFSSPPLF